MNNFDKNKLLMILHAFLVLYNYINSWYVLDTYFRCLIENHRLMNICGRIFIKVHLLNFRQRRTLYTILMIVSLE